MALWTKWIFRAGSGYEIAVDCDGETDHDREEDETLTIVDDVKGNLDLTSGRRLEREKGEERRVICRG